MSQSTSPEASSASTPTRSRAPLQVLGERRIPDSPPPPQTLTETIASATKTTPRDVYTTEFKQEYQHRAAWKAGMLGAFNALAVVFAARMLVLVSIGGAIALTWYCLGNPDLYRLIALGIYCAGTIGLSWLAMR